MYIEGNFIDVQKGEIYPARVTFTKTIQKIQKIDKECTTFIAPGFIDSHLRYEDSLLTPLEFTKLALLSGVTGIVEDCSGFIKIAGHQTLKYVLNQFNKLPIDLYYLYPSNVETRKLESGPQNPTHDEIVSVLQQKNCLGLTQVDDIRKLKENDPVVLKKINAAKTLQKPIISNIQKIHFTEMSNFVQLGIRADIGSNVYQEAFEKACYGLKIKIVEGTKRKTLQNLVRLAKQFDTTIVSEEKSAQELSKNYMKATLKKAVQLGLDPITTIKNVTLNPALLLGIDEGKLEVGAKANIVEIEDLKSFNIKRVFYQGENVVKNDKLQVLKKDTAKEPRFKIDLLEIDSEHLVINSTKQKELAKVLAFSEETNFEPVIEKIELAVVDEEIRAKPEEDILKVVVASCYGDNVISVGFTKGFGMTKGAIATTLHASSGNIIACGVSDEEIATAINELKNLKGGYVAVDNGRVNGIGLPVHGVVTTLSADDLHEQMKKVLAAVKRFGCKLPDPFEVLGSLMNLDKKGYRISTSGLVNTDEDVIVNVFEE